MGNFILVNIRDDKAVRKRQKDYSLIQSVILPYYCEGYVCFSLNKNYSWEELIYLFLNGDEDEEIGSISIIAEKFPCELYKFICNHADCFTNKKLKFVLDYVVPSYLPIILSKEQLLDYKFKNEHLSNIWVKILTVIKNHL